MSKTPAEANSGKKTPPEFFSKAPSELLRDSGGAPKKSKNSGSGAFKTPEIFPELRRSSD